MKCSYCKKIAKCKCNCIRPYMCDEHLKKHLLLKGVHDFENFETEINENELFQLKKKIIDKINQIRMAKNDLGLKTKWFLEKIGEMHQNAVELLNNLIKDYFELLNQRKFCNSEISKIDEIMNTSIVIRNTDFDESKLLIESLYPTEIRMQEKNLLIVGNRAYKKEEEAQKKSADYEKLIEEKRKKKVEKELKQIKSKKYLVKTDEMNLSFKLDYFFPTLVKTFSIDPCRETISELLLSNNGKCLFVCI